MENDIRVLNKKDLRGPPVNAVYVGRPTIWGNPFVIGKDGSRAEVIAKYETWLMSQPQLLSKLHELRGKNLFAGARRRLVMVRCCCDLRIRGAADRSGPARGSFEP